VSVSARRVSLEPAFLLHQYPWRDTSRIFELLTRTHGRVSVFARASRKAASGAGTALQPFGELLVSWTGRGEAGHLTGAERARAPGHLTGDRLMSGFYANELLMKLLERHDPHPRLFDAYGILIAQLADPQGDTQRALRLFEKRLLEELGWGLNLEHEAVSGAPLDAARAYRYRIDGGPEPIEGVAEGNLIFFGSSLLDLAREDLADARSLADARRLLRAALEQCLDGRPLRTREVLVEMRAHGAKADGG
jgi:DNA repair protein RecO (recombination protein O)